MGMNKFRRSTQQNGPFTVGWSGSGYDVTMYTATAGCNLLLDESTDELDLSLTTEIQAAHKLQFRDSSIYLNSSIDGRLDAVADNTIVLTATSINAVGQLNISGCIAIADDLGIAGSLTVGTSANLGSLNVSGSTLLTGPVAALNDLAVTGSLTVSTSANIAGELNVAGSVKIVDTAQAIDAWAKEIKLGGDTTDYQNRTDATQKAGIYSVPHYTNAEESVLGVRVLAQVTNNVLELGGGTTDYNAATNVKIYTAANNITVGGTQRALFDEIGSFLIGDTTNANMTQGLTINQAATDDEILALKSSDVVHTLTTLVEADTYAAMQKLSATGGGLLLGAYSDTDATALVLRGVIGATDPTDTVPAVQIRGGKQTGTTGVALGAAETVFQISDWDDSAQLVTVLGNGNVGIGTPTPVAALDITGSLNVTGSLAISGCTTAGLLGVTGSTSLAVTQVGDGTNYTAFAADGLMTMAATARVIKELWFPAKNISCNTGKNWTAGSHNSASTYAWQYTNSATEGSAFIDFGVPSDMDITATGSIDVLWSSGCVAAANASMLIGYNYFGIGDGGTPGGTGALAGVEASGAGAASAFEYANVTAALVAPAASTKLMTVKLVYIPNTAQTSAGSTFQLNGIVVKYIANKLGTAT